MEGSRVPGYPGIRAIFRDKGLVWGLRVYVASKFNGTRGL